MNKRDVLTMVLAAVLVPVALVSATYYLSDRSLASSPPAASISTGPIATGRDQTRDVSGNCDEAEHRNDPECSRSDGKRPDDRRSDEPSDRFDDHGGGSKPGDDSSGRGSGGSGDDNSGRDHPEDD